MDCVLNLNLGRFHEGDSPRSNDLLAGPHAASDMALQQLLKCEDKWIRFQIVGCVGSEVTVGSVGYGWEADKGVWSWILGTGRFKVGLRIT